ncbi:MAG TPA: AAA family ATPase [Pyrinomonadaceae bacterium]|jgi:ATP/maltotriose-dependent transcriptional regulator MalT
MSISFHENLDYSETSISYDDVSTVSSTSANAKDYAPKPEEIHLFAEKFRVPELSKHISRPRLSELLTKFSEQIGATMITGRAGTGKTTLAADFAQNYDSVAWFRVESSDINWNVFARYFAESFNQTNLKAETGAESSAEIEVSPFLENLFSRLAECDIKKPVLIVLDDVHHIFDAVWFAEFFNSLLHLLNENTHLVLLARSSPAFPLWRLRSKQVLGVVDEDLLLFNWTEAKKFLAGYCLAGKTEQEIFKKSFGRIGKLKSLAEAEPEKQIWWSD